jgi:hypothetical protein
VWLDEALLAKALGVEKLVAEAGELRSWIRRPAFCAASSPVLMKMQQLQTHPDHAGYDAEPAVHVDHVRKSMNCGETESCTGVR